MGRGPPYVSFSLMVTIQLNALDAEAVGGDSQMSALVALVAVHPAAGDPLALHVATFLYAGNPGYRIAR